VTNSNSTSAPTVIAIDGPSGSGKSTVARGVARALGLSVLDTGAMYRAVTLAVLEAGADPHDAAVCTEIARGARIEVHDPTTRLNERDVSAAIRTPDVNSNVSAVSAHAAVREILVAQQREWVETHGGGVVEGRDIGTVVFPGAIVKVFLVAADVERARRRQRDEQAADRDVDIEALQATMARRDALDSGRVASPTAAAEDAVVIDTTDHSANEVIDQIVGRVRAAVGG
jgi:CMP/dCMP kinase